MKSDRISILGVGPRFHKVEGEGAEIILLHIYLKKNQCFHVKSGGPPKGGGGGRGVPEPKDPTTGVAPSFISLPYFHNIAEYPPAHGPIACCVFYVNIKRTH